MVVLRYEDDQCEWGERKMGKWWGMKVLEHIDFEDRVDTFLQNVGYHL
jgi:hypothetical protein